jgi:hypothetical protein
MVDVSIELREELSSLRTDRPELVSFSGLPVMDYGFFPGGNGLYNGSSSSSRSPGGTLLLGSNFGCKSEFVDNARNLITQDERSNKTWDPLLKRLRRAGIDSNECFFANAWPFLHLGEGNLPRELTKSWLKDQVLMTSCLQFFRLTLEKIRPRLIIALGTGPAAFLSHIWPSALQQWGERSLGCLDDLPKARVSYEDYSAICVAIAHPSMPNAFQRRPPYQGIEGEILLLNEGRREAEKILLKSEFLNSESPANARPEPVDAPRSGGRRRSKDLHGQFGLVFSSREGQVFSRREIRDRLQAIFPDFPNGSVVPTDHAEPSPNHVNQCSKCADPRFQIFDTVVDGDGRPGVARYRVRNFIQPR